ncbi:hypothetical protein GGI05_003542 [Coemansia sp. RSA 2603]|nr:hypothetical protein GGI05_003542 [Coemansia sp. RSA 2603]
MSELKEFVVRIEWHVGYTGVMHGVAGWFDLAFVPPVSALHLGTAPSAVYMSTGPQAPATHWQQVRMLFKQPLAVNSGQVVRGLVHMKVNDQRSYDINAKLIVLDAEESLRVSDDALLRMFDSNRARAREALWYLHEQIYNYSYTGEPLEPVRPEAANLYLPVDALLAESASRRGEAPVNVQGVPGSLTDFVITTAAKADAQMETSDRI